MAPRVLKPRPSIRSWIWPRSTVLYADLIKSLECQIAEKSFAVVREFPGEEIAEPLVLVMRYPEDLGQDIGVSDMPSLRGAAGAIDMDEDAGIG